MAQYLIVGGMSGGGRSTAAGALEDLGWFVIDNLPPALIGKISELASQPSGNFDRFCFIAGRGGAESVNELVPAITQLRATGSKVRVLYLDAADDVLVRRFEGTRRRHPLEAEGVLSAIVSERALLRPLRDEADIVLDTTELNTNELRARLVELFAVSEADGAMTTAVVSFGFKHGIPLDVDLVLDCRFLPNPHWVPELRDHTGLDEDVRAYVLDRPECAEFLDRVEDLLAFLLPAYAREGKSYLSVAIGCTGGRHRSVAIAEEMATRIKAQGFSPTVHHRDIGR